jgi:hypothetical protein
MSDSRLAANGETWWFLDLRKTALFACISGGLSSLIPIWNGVRTMAAAGLLGLVLAAVSLLAAVLMLLFMFALYTNEGSLYVPKRLRLLALAAAVILTSMISFSLPQWIGLPGVGTIYYVTTLLGEISGAGQVLVLIALFRTKENIAAANVPISNFLKVATKLALILWGVWLAFNMIRGLMAPYAYMLARDYALQTRRTPPAPLDIISELLMGILNAAIPFSIVYIVSKSIATSPGPGVALLPNEQGAAGEV